MIYCDTSLIVAALTAEVASDAARNWFDRPSADLTISAWTIAEVASALAQKQRRGALDRQSREAVERNWSAMRSVMVMLPVGAEACMAAAALVDAPPRGLRAGDALHLAIATDHRCALATLDRDMADAAAALDLTVHRIRFPAA